MPFASFTLAENLFARLCEAIVIERAKNGERDRNKLYNSRFRRGKKQKLFQQKENAGINNREIDLFRWELRIGCKNFQMCVTQNYYFDCLKMENVNETQWEI
jgi:hypothetical protein